MRVGLFGGTFNPIHLGHQQVAMDVLKRSNLNRVYFIPSALPPHKSTKHLAKAVDRYEMACLALADQPLLSVSDVEIQRPGPSYTYDTLRHFRNIQPSGGELSFILGLDAFLEVHTWKTYKLLFDQAAFIVMTRPDVGTPTMSFQQMATNYAKMYISQQYTLSEDKTALIHSQKKPIYLTEVTPMDITSSKIRQMLRQGKSIQNYVAPDVANHIKKRGLYR